MRNLKVFNNNAGNGRFVSWGIRLSPGRDAGGAKRSPSRLTGRDIGDRDAARGALHRRASFLHPTHFVELTAALDIGPMCTLQQDVQFGVIQIVDIALRAISPAVNDPSTAISCIDQLARILILWMSRFPPDTHFNQPRQVLRVTVPWMEADDLLDTAIEQIRSYSRGDFAVSRRLLRSLEDVVSTVQDERLRAILVMCGERVIQGCRSVLSDEDVVRLE